MNTNDATGAFEKSGGYRFKDPGLLKKALTHSSISGGALNDNERLEFVGDRVLGLVIAREIYQRYPRETEGQLARRLNALVRKETCAEAAVTMGLAGLMILGPGLTRQTVMREPKITADACEAVIAAVFFDGGMEAASEFILRHWAPFIGRKSNVRKDPKSALQEWALGKGLDTPDYIEKERTGPDHDPVFHMAVRIKGYACASGQGPSKRRAEQEAAENFLRANQIWPS